MAPDTRHTWDPDRYLTFADERSRPFRELLVRVDAEHPRAVVDLGCGTGDLTALLAQRWPDADVLGIDSSAEMVTRATASGRLRFEVGDLRAWVNGPSEPVDVLISNATLQWLPDHLDLLPQLVEKVTPGGWFACGVPGNFDEPSHTIRRDLAAQAPYVQHTRDVAVPASHPPETYLDRLAGLGLRADVWETTYLHVLGGDDPVFTWVSATGARPTLQALPRGLREQFEAEFRSRLRAAYPARDFGVVLPFRRIFMVAQRPFGTDAGGSR